METFKVYLPSNASVHVFPNNTLSHYVTHFNKPLQLKGRWEVGVESACYSSRIDNEKEQAQIHCHVKTHDFVIANSLLHPYEYAATSDENGKDLKV